MSSPFAPIQTGGVEVPTPPLEIPTPDIPKANFATIAQQAKEGEQKSNFWPWLFKLLLGWLPDAIAAIVGELLVLVESVIAWFLKLLLKILTNSESGMDQVAATAVTGITGVETSPSDFASFGNAASRSGVHSNVARTLIQAIAGNYSAGAAASIQPSDQGALRFFDFATRMAIEGWILELGGSLIPETRLEELGKLKDAIEQSWGIGRLARRAWGPPVKVLIEDPFTQLLNKTFYPALLSPELLVRQYVRGIIDQSTMREKIALHGYGPDVQDALVNYYKAHVAPSDVVTLLEHGTIGQSAAAQLLTAQGYDDTAAALLIDVEQTKRAQSLAMENAKQAIVEWGKGHLSQADRDLVIAHPLGTSSTITFEGGGGSAGAAYQFSPVELQYLNVLINITHQAATKTRMLSVAEGQQLVEQGLWTLDDYSQLLLDRGYTPADVQSLELLTMAKLTTKSDAQAKAAAAAKARADKAAAAAAAQLAKAKAAAAAAEAKGVGISKFEALVLGGQRTLDDYSVFLSSKGIAADNITALVAALSEKIDKAAAAASAGKTAKAAAAAKGLNLAQLETAVIDGLITMDDFTTHLQANGFNAGDIAILEGELQAKLDSSKAKADARASAAATAKAKHLNLSQEERSVRLGVLSLASYQTWLAQNGFDSADAAVLVTDMQAQLSADKATRATAAKVAASAKAKGLSLQQEEKLVRAGLKTIAQYVADITALGYTSADAQSLAGLLQLTMEQDRETLAASGRAAALPTQRVLSTAELARLAKAGIVQAGVYTAALVRSGVTADDAALLTADLAAGIKATKAGQSATTTASKTLSAVGLSLSKLEGDVRSNRLTLAEFTSVLLSHGVTAAAVDAITGVLEQEIANAAAVAKLVTDATQRAAAKGLSLSQETAAVAAGVKTITDFAAFVTQLGYDAADAATLIETEQAKLQKSAAGQKAAPTPVAPVV